MKIKVNHYFSKNPDLPITFGIEAILTELFATVLAAFFAFMGYQIGLLGLFFLCAGASIVCAIATIYTTYEFLRVKYFKKKSKAEDSHIRSNEA